MAEKPADGRVVIEAGMDTSDIRRGTEEILRLLTVMKKNAAVQFAALRGNTTAEISAMSGQVTSIMRRMTPDMASAVTGGQTRLLSAARGVMSSVMGEMTANAAGFSAVGGQMMAGVAAGIRASSSAVYAAARNAALTALSAMKAELGIQSPSRVMREEVGMQIGAGLAEGLEKSIPAVGRAAGALAVATAGATASVSAGSGAGASAVRASAALRRENYLLGMAQAQARFPVPAVVGADGASVRGSRANGANTTIVFTKPVETPSAHARALRSMMEEVLYGR